MDNAFSYTTKLALLTCLNEQVTTSSRLIADLEENELRGFDPESLDDLFELRKMNASLRRRVEELRYVVAQQSEYQRVDDAYNRLTAARRAARRTI